MFHDRHAGRFPFQCGFQVIYFDGKVFLLSLVTTRKRARQGDLRPRVD
jgi:hypothetical protein